MPNDGSATFKQLPKGNDFKPETVKAHDEKPVQSEFIFHQSMIKPREIKERHIDGIVIKSGLAASRPDGTTHTKAFFSTDTNVLSIWNGTAWKSVTLS